jgi:hypothetical protein
MRRKENEIRDRATQISILRAAEVCRIGLSEGNMPYVVPMNFSYRDGCLYLHSSMEGKKIDIIRKNNNVCFEVDVSCGIVKSEKACNWSIKYSSVIGFGKAILIEDMEEKKKALDIIMEKYSGTPSFEYAPGQIEKVAIIKIEIEEMTGKKSE